jgi:predicted ArsR family transcriptional regulator
MTGPAAERTLAALAALERDLVDLHTRRELLVAVARVNGVGWPAIARTMGITTAAARHRFARIVDDLTRAARRRSHAV